MPSCRTGACGMRYSCIIISWTFFLSGFACDYQWREWMQPVSPHSAAVITRIPPGSSFKSVAAMLKERGFIRSEHAFYILAWYRNMLKAIKAGEYYLSPSMKPGEILDIISTGRSIEYQITIPEGYNIFQIAALLRHAKLIKKKGEFISAVRDAAFLKKFSIPAESAEGYLFPDSYLVPAGYTPQDMAALMINRFREVWYANSFDTRVKKLNTTRHRVVILASIVEEEAMRQEERPLIASVFWNRLGKNMPLQADPTVRYGIMVEQQVKKRRLHWKDLRRSTPYNTYTIKGLPKGPISNPGLESIKAVLYPADTKYLYFVSRNNGTHKFSTNLRDHNRAVEHYQKRRRSSKKN